MDLPKELTLGNDVLMWVNLLQLLEVMSSMLSGCVTSAAFFRFRDMSGC